MKVTVECDVESKEVFDEMTDSDIFKEAEIDADMCQEILGDEVLEAFNEKQVVEYFDEHNLLDEIGQTTAAEYFDLVEKE